MTDSAPNQTPSRIQRFHAGLLRFCKHPASILVWFCLFSLVIKEQYPFSHYPMYSGWSHRTHYFYVADQDGPIKAKQVFKVSVPRTKKLYGGIVDEIEDERDLPNHELTEADFAEAGRRLLEKLRDEAPPKRRKKFAEIIASDLSLVRVDIIRERKEFTTEERTIVTTNAEDEIVDADAPDPETNP
ncbi:MAG: hypothetical protein ACR2RV_09575 [Verrucomicrobiales bacterium]